MNEGGLGLKRVCVIDFDVHHGNGTQEILCKTYDPRFLYISMHAGTKQAGVGYSSESDEEAEEGEGGKKRGKDDIFPGKCGDKSPHKVRRGEDSEGRSDELIRTLAPNTRQLTP